MDQKIIDEIIRLMSTKTIIRGRAKFPPMNRVARELGVSDKTVKKVWQAHQKDMEGKDVKPNPTLTRLESLDEKRRKAELFVLTRVGKCTDSFAELEKQVASNLAPTKYARDMSRPLAKVSIGFIPRSERN